MKLKAFKTQDFSSLDHLEANIILDQQRSQKSPLLSSYLVYISTSTDKKHFWTVQKNTFETNVRKVSIYFVRFYWRLNKNFKGIQNWRLLKPGSFRCQYNFRPTKIIKVAASLFASTLRVDVFSTQLTHCREVWSLWTQSQKTTFYLYKKSLLTKKVLIYFSRYFLIALFCTIM